MATSLVKDYNDMIKSIETYGGFYIGRYELSAYGEKKNKDPLVNTTWYQLYANCKDLSINNSVETRMIWGLNWDATMKWFLSSEVEATRTYVTNSAGKGHYSSSSTIQTGSNSNYAVNNIYDMAGNVLEWTQEAYDTEIRASRGGYYYPVTIYYGSSHPASYRNGYGPSSTYGDVGSRAVLYANV